MYMQLRYFAAARDMYREGGKLARAAGQPALAQRAAIDEALTYALGGDPKRALSMLQESIVAPVNAENLVLSWLTAARARREMKDAAGYAEAKKKALEAASTPELRSSTEAALADLDKS
jgi:hypothetical protein